MAETMKLGGLDPSREASFTRSCMPETQGYAEDNISLLEPLLAKMDPRWSFSDKVLVFVFPSFEKEVTECYDGDGRPMLNLLQPHQVDSIDHAAKRVLKDKLRCLKGAATRRNRQKSDIWEDAI